VVTPELAKDLSLSVDRGLLVTSVEEDSPADAIGIRVKDVLFQIGRFYVTDLEGLGTLLEELKPGQAVKVGVARGSVAAWVTLRTRKDK
jgi:S1-C subfamily serine protease